MWFQVATRPMVTRQKPLPDSLRRPKRSTLPPLAGTAWNSQQWPWWTVAHSFLHWLLDTFLVPYDLMVAPPHNFVRR